jgi:hypothetical protein
LHLDISNNGIRAEGGKALAEALKGNQVVTELNIAGNSLGQDSNFVLGWGYGDDMSGVIALADVIPGMGAMTSLDLANNNIGQLAPPTPCLMAGKHIQMANLTSTKTDRGVMHTLCPVQSHLVLSLLAVPSPI